MNTGIPQGSVLSPVLWNIYVLRLKLPRGEWVIGYPDDLAVVITGRTTQELENIVEIILQEITRWIRSNDLSMDVHKSDAMLLKRRRNSDFPVVQIERHTIKVGRFINISESL